MYKLVQGCIKLYKVLKYKKYKKKGEYHMNAQKNEYLSIQEFAKEIGVCTQTIRRWDVTDKLKPHHRTPNGYRVYTQAQVNDYLQKN